MAPVSQRVLVVGATGLMGSYIAKEAASKGHRVSALVSEKSLGDPGKKTAVGELKAAGVELVKGSLDSPQNFLVELAKKADVVSTHSASFVCAHLEAPGQVPLAHALQLRADNLRRQRKGRRAANQPCPGCSNGGQCKAVLPR